MTKQGFLEFDGQVMHADPGGLVYITLDNNVEILANPSNPAQNEPGCHP